MKGLLSALAASTLAFTTAQAAFVLDFTPPNIKSSNEAGGVIGTGASGRVSFSFADGAAGEVVLTLEITNATGDLAFGRGATASRLTGFAFDIPDIATVVGHGAGSFLSGYLADVSLPPFGTFDVGFADDKNFLGGKPKGALPEGLTETVSLTLKTAYLGADEVESAFVDGINDGNLRAAMRFQDVNGGANKGASDKLFYTGTIFGPDPVDVDNPVPVPGALVLMVSALAGGGLFSRRRGR